MVEEQPIPTVNHTQLNHERPKNVWKIVSTCMLLCVLLTSYFLILEHSHMQEREAEFSALRAQYESLKSNMTHLQNSYDNTNENYESLKQKYDMLFQNPPSLQTTFARPLEKKQVPSLTQLQTWLSIDQTDKIGQYNDPDFVCTDFAAMLVVHARTKEWQMGLIFVYGNDTSTHKEWNHAFNAIVTTEGLVYVEPQNDGVWWYANHQAIRSGRDYEMEQYDPVTIHVNDIEIVVSY